MLNINIINIDGMILAYASLGRSYGMWYIACLLIGGVAGFFIATILAAKERLFESDRRLKGMAADEVGDHL